MSNPEKIESFISSHLAGGLYAAAPADQQQAALAMAEQDILCKTGPGTDRSSDLFAAAVAEQAIFLLLNCSRIASPVTGIISESVDGAGSVTYDTKERYRFFSPRALELCNAMKCPTVALQRG